jgi:hypothetical protein
LVYKRQCKTAASGNTVRDNAVMFEVMNTRFVIPGRRRRVRAKRGPLAAKPESSNPV